MDPLRGFLGLGLYLLVLASYWLIQAAYLLEKSVSRRDGKLRRWKFGKSERTCSSPTSTADSGSLAVDRQASFATSSAVGGSSLFCVRLQRWPVEAFFRMLLSIIAFACEVALSALNGGWPGEMHLHRITLYALFGLSGLMELLHGFRVLYPTGSGQFLLALAFSAEACFYWDASTPEDRDYILPCTVIMLLCSAVIFLEIWNNGQQALLKLLRVFFVAWQGSWLVYTGIRQILRVTETGSEEEEEKEATTKSPQETGQDPLLIVVCFWHAVVVFVVLTLIVTLVRLVRRAFRNGSMARHISWCPCVSADEFNDSFRRSPTEDFEETEPLAMHP